MLRQSLLTLSNSRELQDVALHNGLARRFALRFVAGETLEQAVGRHPYPQQEADLGDI